MKITSVSTDQHYKYIPLQGWDSVKAALYTYAFGDVKGSHATEQVQLRDVARSVGFEGTAWYVYLADHMKGPNDEFIERMLAEAQQTHQEWDDWRRGYDYDGRGPFFKTTVEINILDREAELFALGINAAYVGSEPEANLAEQLSIGRALIRSNVRVEVEPLDEAHFAFDFEWIIRRLDDVLDTQQISGDAVANFVMMGTPIRQLPCPIYHDEIVTIKISPDQVEHRFVYDEPGKPRGTWSVEGSVLTGLLAESYEDSTKKYPPTAAISLVSAQSEDWRNPPIYEPIKKDYVLDLTERIAQALR